MEENAFPNLFIPGAGKSGSSSLHEYLKLHPDIFMTEVKEPHFFSNDPNYFNKKNEYKKLFEESENYIYRGESSTGYMVFDNTIERIKEDCKSPKFVFILRNPIDRCFSHYNWVKSFNKEKENFENAILHDKDDQPNPLNNFGGGYKYYFQFGLYGKWIDEYIQSFGRENILIITTEELKKNHQLTLNNIYSFLSLNPVEHNVEVVTNKTKFYNKNVGLLIKLKKIKKRLKNIPIIGKLVKNKTLKKWAENFFIRSEKVELTREQRRWLKIMYEEDVKKLKEISGMDFEEWTDFAQ